MGWDWVTLSQFLPNSILQRLASVELIADAVGDNHVWKVSKTGRFTIQSAIQLLQESESAGTETWSKMWKIHTPRRVRFFMWLLFHRRLLTNAERFR